VITFPPQVTHELAGWTLFWADLEARLIAPEKLAALRREVAERARETHARAPLAEHATAAAVRRLFHAAGCDPTRYRPSSEALLRRVLKAEELPAIHPFVDLNNCLSVELVVPACVLAYGSAVPPFTLRAGCSGERMASLRGPIDLAGKPLLADAEGPFGTPITDSERVRVGPETGRAWLVCYLPTGVSDPERALQVLASLLAAAPVAVVRETAVTRAGPG
jgi:DNA/RNA-binding domain of Phe-tRNA-synthetase-like protein